MGNFPNGGFPTPFRNATALLAKEWNGVREYDRTNKKQEGRRISYREGVEISGKNNCIFYLISGRGEIQYPMQYCEGEATFFLDLISNLCIWHMRW